MILTTTNHIDGKPVQDYLDLLSGDASIGANLFKDIFAAITDVIGGRAGQYEKVLREAKEAALVELEARANSLGADAVLGIDLDYEVIGRNGSMLMVSANGTAVRL